MDNAFPRALITTRIGRSASAKSQPVGPFPSKAAAERYLEEVLNLFLLRRCLENLDPDPSHPGCAYSEMKKCLAPCYKGCTPERYQQEAEDVEQFLVTRGQSLLERVDRDRREASERLEFEQAAALHQRYLKIEAVAAQMPEAARALNALNGMIVQPGSAPDHVDLFSLERGALSGPVSYSTIGMRLHNELSGSSSLYTQPMALQAVPLAEDGTTAVMAKELPRDMLEARLDDALQVFAGTSFALCALVLQAPDTPGRRGSVRECVGRCGRPVAKTRVAPGNFPGSCVCPVRSRCAGAESSPVACLADWLQGESRPVQTRQVISLRHDDNGCLEIRSRRRRKRAGSRAGKSAERAGAGKLVSPARAY
jgi:hypothetical protein